MNENSSSSYVKNSLATNLIEYGSFVLPLIAILVVFISLPLKVSFWLDESITFWIVSHPKDQIVDLVNSFQAQSPLYFILLKFITELSGDSEVALRAPSIFLSAITLILIIRLGYELIDLKFGIVSALFLSTLDGFIQTALSARPYALALSLSVTSVLLWVRWLKFRGSFTLFLSLLCLVLAFYTHYLFIGVLLAHLGFYISISNPSNTPTSKYLTILLSFISLLALYPGVLSFAEVIGRSSVYKYPWEPSVRDLLNLLLPSKLLVYLVVSLLVARIYTFYSIARQRYFGVFILWFVAPTISFFLISKIFGGSLLLSRYLLWTAPACALLSSLVVYSINSNKARELAICTISILVVLVPRVWIVEDWKGAIRSVNQEIERGGSVPILWYPGLIEAESETWLRDPIRTPYFLAPTSAYPIVNLPTLIPSNPLGSKYFNESAKPIIDKADSFILVSPHLKQFADPTGRLRTTFNFLDLFTSLGFSAETLFEDGLVKVIRFKKTLGD